MRPVMVLGCTSDAGKSLVATALCRWFARQGVRVAPFKAQNMSNNARVVGSHGDAPGGEIGVAQWLQAKAAGVEPDVRMNPVLVKPEADTRSQVVVRGVVDREISRLPWDDRHDALWEAMRDSYDHLSAEYDLIILEGAGSPAEINLRDQVNNRMIEYVDAAGFLLSDIDRGGSFAHLYGTWALVPDATRDRLAGFVLNRFRGDASLLSPGPERLSDMTGMTYGGAIPMLRHDLPREEGATIESSAPAGAPRVLLPRFPFGSNLDEFHLLATAAAIGWETSPAAFADLDADRDLIILPGSKHVFSDLDWMRTNGIAEAIVAAIARGVRCVGVCGGAMMLGQSIDDPHGVESDMPSKRPGLAVLDHETVMGATKITTRTDITVFGQTYAGYEIRYGELAPLIEDNNVLATTLHGLFEHPDFVERLLGVSVAPVLDKTFDLLADTIDKHLDTTWLRSLL